MKDLSVTIDEAFARAQAIFWKKNQAYGTQNIAETGIDGVLARLSDKIGRCRQLTRGAAEGDESLLDAATDITNYGAILAALVLGEWPATDTLDVLVSGDHENFRQPALTGDVGFDLCSKEDVTVPPRGATMIWSGVSIKCPRGTWARITGRSSTWSKLGLLVADATIDNGYTGELGVGCISLRDEPVKIEAGQRIGQVVFCPAVVPPMSVVDRLPETARSSNGFGSTGR